MHPYSRPPPPSASPAANLRTNPTRTNNQRRSSQESASYSTTPPYSDRGVDESEGEVMSRGEQTADMDEKHYQKVNQVIQVGRYQSVLIAQQEKAEECALIQCRTSSPKPRLLWYHPESHYLRPTAETAS